MKFEIKECDVCKCEMVICPNCKNNCCSGGNGKNQDGSACKICDLAYQYQDLYYQLNPQK